MSPKKTRELTACAEAVKELASAVTKTRLSGKALSRLNSELNLITRRVLSKEYEHSAFNTNVLNIPDRAQELIDDLSFFFHLGQIWKPLFKSVALRDPDHILDIGAGYFPKVEVALYYYDFKGSVDLFDVDLSALHQAKRFMQFFNLPFSTKLRSGGSLSALQGKYDLICANHFFDDYLLAEYCKQNGIDLSKVYASEAVFADIWNKISLDQGFKDLLVANLARELCRLTKPGGRILMLEYLSNSQASLGIRYVRKYSASFQRSLKKELLSMGFRAIAKRGKNNYSSGSLKLRDADALMMMRR
jgi:hypothetical protein